MDFRPLLLSLFLGLSTLAFSQNLTQSIKGKVLDADTKQTLIGVSVILADSDPPLGTMTDVNGHFILKDVPIGRHDLFFSYMGYEDAAARQILVESGKQAVINISLKESLTQLAEVNVVAKSDQNRAINVMASVSARQLSVESTSRIAAGISDPARTAQSFAGVASSNDEGNELVIRGNSPRGMLWRMEGVEIPNPNHFTDGEGSAGGGVSALSTQVLANSDFYTAAFPAEYGNALSGVFDLKLRNGNYDKREYSVQLGVLGAQLSAEGPLKENSEASYLINYRYSTLEMLSAAGINVTSGDIIPRFQDISFKLNLPTESFGRFAIWGLGAMSSAGITAEADTSKWEFRSQRFGETEKHKIGILGLNHNYLLKNRKSYIKTVLSVSYSSFNKIQDSLNFNAVSSIVSNQGFENASIRLNSYFNHKIGAKNLLRAGVNLESPQYALKEENLNYDTGVLNTVINENGHSYVFRVYGQWQHRFNTRLEINSGFHYTHFLLNNKNALEPRFGLNYQVNDAHKLSFGAGLHSRLEPMSIYLASKNENGISTQPNKNLALTKALHLVGGYSWLLAKNLSLKLELYYQYLYDVPVRQGDTTGVLSLLNFGSGITNENYSNLGNGENYGIELSIEKHFSQAYYFLFTSSLFESKYTIPGFKARDTRFNSNYIFNALGGKEWTVGNDKDQILGLNLRTIWRGGYRFIPYDLDASANLGKAILDYKNAFNERLKDYMRIDLGVTYQKSNANWSWKLSLNLQNVTNRLNVWGQTYNAENDSVEVFYMNGLLPVINYRVQF